MSSWFRDFPWVKVLVLGFWDEWVITWDVFFGGNFNFWVFKGGRGIGFFG